MALEKLRILDATDSDSETKKLIYTSQNETLERFKSAERSAAPNRKMLKTYRGADNMKLKVIDQSVLKTHGTSTRQLKQSLQKKDVEQTHIYEEETGTQRRSIIHDFQSLEEEFLAQKSRPAQVQTSLSPLESAVIGQASPASKIKSFQALLREESQQNELRIAFNQENFKNLINPEVTRREYTILGRSAAKNVLHMSHLQN